MRQTKLQKILNTAVNQGANEKDLVLLKRLVEISPLGVINDFPAFHKEILKGVFEGNNYAFIESTKFLVEMDFIKFDKYDHKRLLILACEENHLFKIQHANKRKYGSNPFEKIDGFLSNLSKRMQKIISPAVNTAKREMMIESISIKWDKLLGIKIPRNLEPILTGTSENFKYSREKIRYICGLISQLDSDAEIKDFTLGYIVKQLESLFDKGTINEYTIKDVHAKLLEEGILEQEKIGKKTIVRFKGYKEGFSNGYIVVPYCVFKWLFKKIRTASCKIFFDSMFKWNNGENRTKGGTYEVNPEKPVIFKLCLAGNEDVNTKNIYSQNLKLWLKKRCPSEVVDLLYGENGFLGLDQIFDIDYTPFDKDKKGCIHLKVKQEYRILKSDVKKLERAYNPVNRYRQKAQIVKKIFDKYKVEYNQQDWKDFVQIFKEERGRVIEKIVQILVQDISNRAKKGYKRIERLGAYVNTIYKNYLIGGKMQEIEA